MSELRENIAETVARETRRPTVITGNGVDYIAVPKEWELHDTERDEPNPRRKKGKVTLDDADSFIAYTKRHGSMTSSTLWCRADYKKGNVSFTAILNDHAEDENSAAWRDHIATFNPKFSAEFECWFSKNKHPFTQFDFAQFLEENVRDIANQNGMPTGAQMLEMALAFESNQDMRIKSAIRLQNGGVQLNFVQDDDAATIAKMSMFDRFAIGIPVFWGDGAYAMEARLRYRTREGKLTFWFELIRPERVLEDAAKQIIEKIKAGTGRPMFLGTAI